MKIRSMSFRRHQGPGLAVARLRSPGKISIPRARYVGTITYAFTWTVPAHSLVCLARLQVMCRHITSALSRANDPSPSIDDEALLEAFRSLQMSDVLCERPTLPVHGDEVDGADGAPMSFAKWFAATSNFAMADSDPPWYTLTDFMSTKSREGRPIVPPIGSRVRLWSDRLRAVEKTQAIASST